MKIALTILNIVFIFIAGFLFLSTLDFPSSYDPAVPGPAYWPRVVLAFLIFISLLHLIKIWFLKEEIPPAFERPFFVVFNIILLSAYLIMMSHFGFYFVTFVYLITVFYVLKVKTWKLRLSITLITLLPGGL